MKRFIVLLTSLLLVLSLTACGGDAQQQLSAFDEESKAVKYKKELIAENANYRLSWDGFKSGVTLTDIATGQVWGTSPAADSDAAVSSLGMPAKRHNMVESPLVLYYRDAATGNDNMVYSYSGVNQEGHICCTAIDNGLLVEYYFDAAKIMIPVQYVLHEDYVSISIDTAKIQESENQVTAVALAPMWCSAKNDSENSYLFIPSGSGALGDTKTVSQQGRSYSEWIYGDDVSMEELYRPTETADIRLPVYGAKSGETASLAVIEEGAEIAAIEATSGSSAYGYSAVYPKFQLRGYTVHQAWVFTSNLTDSSIYTSNIATTPISVRFYPLSGSNADYSGMARTYRKYLTAENGLSGDITESALNVNIIGGSLITKSFLGVPYTTVYATTTLKQAADIIADIDENVSESFTVKLQGFGTTGVDMGEIAGGFTVSDKIGTVSGLKKLGAQCLDSGIDLYADFDIMTYNRSGGGFSTFSDNATTAGQQKAYKYPYHKTTRIEDKTSIYYLLSPHRFIDAANKLVDKTEKWKLAGISLSTLTSMAYSDYSAKDSVDYYSRNGLDDTVTEVINTVKADNKFMATAANVYAAVLADVITETPTASAGENFFTQDIPFYQMVFKGLVPMTSESINLAANPQKTLLKAVESGIGLNYTVISKWDVSLIDADYPYFYGSVYADMKQDMFDGGNRLADYYGLIDGAEIASHQILDNGIRVTVFDNGVTVYVNLSDTPQSTPAGEVSATDFIVLEGV